MMKKSDIFDNKEYTVRMENSLAEALHAVRAIKGKEVGDDDIAALADSTNQDILDACHRMANGFTGSVEEEHDFIEDRLEELEMMVEAQIIGMGSYTHDRAFDLLSRNA
jgi:hypothetical protein